MSPGSRRNLPPAGGRLPPESGSRRNPGPRTGLPPAGGGLPPESWRPPAPFFCWQLLPTESAPLTGVEPYGAVPTGTSLQPEAEPPAAHLPPEGGLEGNAEPTGTAGPTRANLPPEAKVSKGN